MRVLFSSVPEVGHLHPMLGLARALAEAGHQVAFAVSPDLEPRARQGGFETLPVGQELADWYVEAYPSSCCHKASTTSSTPSAAPRPG